MDELVQGLAELGLPEGETRQHAEELFAQLPQQFAEMDAMLGAAGPVPELQRALLTANVAEARRVVQSAGAAQRAELWAAPMPMCKMPPLHYAASQGSLELVRLLLDAGCPVDHVGPNLHQTVLFFSTWACSPEVVELLLSRGANPLHSNRQGLNALEYCQEQDPKNLAVLRDDVPPPPPGWNAVQSCCRRPVQRCQSCAGRARRRQRAGSAARRMG
ncbi:hypothetical protein ABPG75_000303 [Micractinium tetrahymenae]